MKIWLYILLMISFLKCTALNTGKPACLLHDFGLDIFTNTNGSITEAPKPCYINYEKDKAQCIARYLFLYEFFVSECKRKNQSTNAYPTSSCEQQHFISILGATCCPYGGCDM